MNQANHPEPEIDPRLAEMLELLRPTPPRDPDAAARGKARFLKEVEATLPIPSYSPLRGVNGNRRNNTNHKENPNMKPSGQKLAMRTVAIIVIVLALLFGGVGITAYAAESAMPGDVLYPIKTSVEQTRLMLAADAAEEGELHLELAQRRLDELSGLISAGRLNGLSQVAEEFEFHVDKAIESYKQAASGDPLKAQELALKIAAALSRYAQTLMDLLAKAPEEARPALTQAMQMASEKVTEEVIKQAEIDFSGKVEGMTAAAWTIGGRTVALTDETTTTGAIQMGDSVKVHARVNADGSLTALKIEEAAVIAPAEETEFTGTVEAMTAAALTIEGRTVALTSQTQIRGAIQVGDEVKVRALQDADGNLTALEIELVVAATPTPQQEIELSGTVEAIADTSWTVAGRAVAITSETEISGTIQVGDTVKVRALVGEDGSLTARVIELVAAVETPTPTPEPVEVQITGGVEAISATSWTINDQTVAITTQTEISGTILVGSQVDVWALTNPDGTLTATRISLK